MENDDKHRIHQPQGHENHGGHVCHKCGWTFPNSHPSAKQRRAHKKVCGKIEGFKLIGSEDKSHSDSDLSDEDQKLSKSIGHGLDEKVGGIAGEEVTKSEDEVFSDAVTEFADSESRHMVEEVLVSGTQEPNKNAQRIADEMHHFPTDKKINLPEEPTFFSSAYSLEPESLKNESMDKSDVNNGEDANSVAVVGLDLDEKGSGNYMNDKMLSAAAIPPVTKVEVSSDVTVATTLATTDESSRDTVMDSKVPESITADDSSKDTVMESKVTESTTTNDSSKNVVTDAKVMESTVIHTQDDQDNALEQLDSLSEVSTTNHSHCMKVEAAEHLGVCLDTPQVLDGSVQSDPSAEVDSENQSGSSSLEDIPAGNFSEIKSDDSKVHAPLKPEAPLTSTCVEKLESKESQCHDLIHDEVPSGPMAINFGESADVLPVIVQVHEDNLQVDTPGSKNTSKQLIVDQSGVDEGIHDKGSRSIETNSSESIVKELYSDGLNTNSDSTKASTPDGAVIRASEVDAAHGHSVGDKPTLSCEEREPQHGFSHEILQETPIVHVAGVSLAGSACTEIHQGITNEVNRHGILHKETGTEHTVVGDCCEELLRNDGSSLPSTKITPDFDINATEMKPQFCEGAGINEAEGNPQLIEAMHADTTVASKGLDTDRSPSGSISDSSCEGQTCHNENFQASSKDLAPDSSINLSILKMEKEVEGIETDNSTQENLDESSKVGSYHVDAQNLVPVEPVSLAVVGESCARNSFVLDNESTKDLTNRDVCEDGNEILKLDASASVLIGDASVDSISQTDSMEGQCGSVSDCTIPSTREATDMTAILPTEGLPDINVETKRAASATNLNLQSPQQQHADDTDVFEPPSFMTLVETNTGDNRQQTSGEIESAQNPQHPKSPTSQPGWFPSLTNVVNESQGRKKNEEIIAKVVNWNTAKTHTPLRSLLVDANVEGKHKASPTVQDRSSPKAHEYQAPEDGGAPAKTAPEVPTLSAAKEAVQKEWNSPARMPVIKREKRKVRGYWVPFVCCSSIN